MPKDILLLIFIIFAGLIGFNWNNINDPEMAILCIVIGLLFFYFITNKK